MNRLNFLKASILGAGLTLLPQAHAADVRVLVYGEHAGTDIVYRYTLVNNGSGKMMQFGVGVKDAGDGDKKSSPATGVYSHNGQANAFGTLTRLPTGTRFVPNSDNWPSSYDVPEPNPASVTSPTQPVGWSVKISGYRARGLYSIDWTAPQPVYGGPVNVTGADAGQTLSGFSVRVPATSAAGPGAVGSLDPYVTGGFEVQVWLGASWLDKREQQIFAPIEKQDTTPPVLSVTATPNNLRPPNNKLVPVTINVSVKDDYDPQPEIKLESITANEALMSGDTQGAALGTDDRTFSLMATRLGTSTAGRIYTVTYSATDGTGNKSTATTTVTVPHDQGK
jgi:hypothetical protein